MSEHISAKPTSRIRLWRYLPILIILGLAVHLLAPQITTLENSWAVVQKMTWWAVALAVTAQVLSYLGSGYTLHAILYTHQERLSTLRGALITMASTSIGLVAGGWVGVAAATYGWVHRENHDVNTATLAGTLPALLNNAVLFGVAIIGVIYLLVVHDLSQLQLLEFGLILLALVLTTLGIASALHSPGFITPLVIRLSSRWAELRHEAYDPQETISAVGQFVTAWDSLGNGTWLQPALGAMANIGFDILTLYFLFVSAGYNITLGVLFAGYGLPFILGKLAFIFPGGVGVIEGSMVAMYESLQIPNNISVVVILGYRLFSFWLPSVLGFVAASYLSSPQRGANSA